MKKTVCAFAVIVGIIATYFICSTYFGSGNILNAPDGTYSTLFYDFNLSDNTESGSYPVVDFDYSASKSPVRPSDYYNYNKLNDTQKAMYKDIYNAAITMQIGNVRLINGSKRDAAIAMYAVKYDNPQIFWLGYEYGLGASRDNTVFIRLDEGKKEGGYLFTHDERTAMMQELHEAVTKIVNECVTSDMSELEIELVLHDWICKNVEYDKESGDVATSGERSKANHASWTAYGALVNRSAVCEGYSKAFQLLMYYSGINCNLLSGVTSDQTAHMWNIVQLSDSWYNVDVLWNDVEDSEFAPVHSFFNVTTEFISKTHTLYPDSTTVDKDDKIFTAEYNLAIPSCINTELNYYVYNNTLIESDELYAKVVTEALKRASEEGRETVEFFYNYKDINKNVVSYDAKKNRIFSSVKGYFKDFKGLKYEAFSYGSFIISVAK